MLQLKIVMFFVPGSRDGAVAARDRSALAGHRQEVTALWIPIGSSRNLSKGLLYCAISISWES